MYFKSLSLFLTLSLSELREASLNRISHTHLTVRWAKIKIIKVRLTLLFLLFLLFLLSLLLPFGLFQMEPCWLYFDRCKQRLIDESIMLCLESPESIFNLALLPESSFISRKPRDFLRCYFFMTRKILISRGAVDGCCRKNRLVHFMHKGL